MSKRTKKALYRSPYYQTSYEKTKKRQMIGHPACASGEDDFKGYLLYMDMMIISHVTRTHDI